MSLINKLYAMDFSDRALDWFTSCLTDPGHFINYNGQQSDTAYIVHGILQNSILGPLMLILYTNDMLQNLKLDQVHAYADELTTCYSDILYSF